MGIEIDVTTLNPLEPGETITALHVRCIPMMASTLIEIVTYRGWGLDRPVLRIRGTIPYPLMEMPHFHQAIWALGDELQRTAQELYDE